MNKCSDTLTEEGRHFARDRAKDGSEGATTTTPPIERARAPPDPSGGTKSNDAMLGESPHDRLPRRCDRRKILRMSAFFLVAFGVGAVVGLMVLQNDGESPNSAQVSVSYVEPTGGFNDVSGGGDAETDTFAKEVNEPLASGLLRSTRSPSPSLSLQPTVKPVDTSGAWYSVQWSPSPTQEETTLQSNPTSISSPTDEFTMLQSSSTAIPLQNGTTATAPTGINSTSTSNIITKPSNYPASTPLTIDLSSWLDAFDSLTIVPETTVTTTTTTSTTATTTTTKTTSTELDEVTSNSTMTATMTQAATTTESSVNLDVWVDTFNEITAAGGAAPCLTDEACDAQRQKLGFTYFEVGD